MAAQFSPLSFFRKVPNALLARYFDSHAAELPIDWTLLKERDGQAVLDAFKQLDNDQQARIEADFQDVHALACEAGITALVDEAAFHENDTFRNGLDAVDGLHAKAMWVFIERPTYWNGATMFLRADNVATGYWKKRNDLPKVMPHVEEDDIEALAEAISEVFYDEGRGQNCKVEPYRRYNREYFFAYPEDFSSSAVEWVSDSLETRSRKPAFEIIFVYCEEEGSLDIFAPRNTKKVAELQSVFAEKILKLPALPNGSIDKRVYDLAPLKDENFEFSVPPESGIESVVVTKMRLTALYGGRKHITLEADTKDNPKAVYELRDSLNAPAHTITQLGVRVTFEPVDGKRARTKSFNISLPNSCNLKNDKFDLQIRQMLGDSGISPRTAAAD